MEDIPPFWRPEVYHPLVVHFPIALLLVGTIFKIAGFWKKGRFLILPSIILILAGTIGGWIAIYTGDLADGIVSRTLCDPTILKTHENNAYTMVWIFTIAALLDIFYYFKLSKYRLKIVNVIILALLLTGCGFLIKVGHTGASLVYQQAAGVYTPSPDCAEFN